VWPLNGRGMPASAPGRAPRSVRLASWLLIGSVAASPSPALADGRLHVASVNFESPDVIVPVVWVTGANEHHEWTLGLTGWTLSGDWRGTSTPRRRWHLFARATPTNAYSSNRIYLAGRRVRAAEFRAAAFEIGAGTEVRHRRGWTGGYRAVATHDAIRAPAMPAIEDFWARPFVGVEVAEQYERVTSEDFLGARWDGVKVGGAVRVMTGAHTWSRAAAHVRAGKRAGRLFATGELDVFGGHSLNTVSATLVGGSWDLPAPHLLTGYRYGEFRRTHGAVLGGGLDLRLRGSWQVGVRTGCLTGGGQNRAGTALQLATVWQGIVMNGGVAFPGSGDRAVERRPVLFATMTAAVLRR
jgi:hypothetical protein